jgi:hypothetical protein
MPTLRHYLTRVVFPFLFVLLAAEAQAFPVRMLDVKAMLASSDAVYKVSVQSTREQGVWTRDPTTASLQLPKVVAKARVISAIKGTAHDSIEITFPGFPHTRGGVTNWPMYTSLSTGWTYIVFLKGKSSPYRFADPQTGAMIVPAKPPAVSYGSTPQDKLLAELVSAAQIGDETIGKFAVEQLGKLGDIRAAAVLVEPLESSDPAQRTSALVARIRVGDAPDQEDLLSILRSDPADLKSREAMHTGISGREVYYAASEQIDIVMAIEMSVKASQSYGGRAEKQLKGFDYVGFVTKALECNVIKQNDILRSDLVGTLRNLGDPKSVPLLLKVLADPSQRVRYMAATSFAVLAGDKTMYPAGEIFNKNEAKYLERCREWASKHPDGI